MKVEKEFERFQIPTDLGASHVARSSNVFLLLEDDNWCQNHISLQSFEEDMQRNNMVIVKLFWGNNLKIVKGEIVGVSDAVEEMKPRLPLLPIPVLKWIFYNKSKLNSILYRLGFIEDGVHF